MLKKLKIDINSLNNELSIEYNNIFKIENDNRYHFQLLYFYNKITKLIDEINA